MSDQQSRVVITAGASGIGLAIVRKFADAGARIAVCDVDDNALQSLKAELPGVYAARADVGDEATLSSFLEQAREHLGVFDVLVNNAGTAGPTAPIEDVSSEDWHTCLNVNLTAAFLCSRFVAASMKSAQRGLIINLASTAGQFGFPNRVPYACAKWAIIGLTKTLAMELGPHGVRVNAIAPGPVEGDRMDRVIAGDAAVTGRTEEEVRAEITRSNSLRTFIAADDIADAVMFLASENAARINGQVLNVDGHTEFL